MDNVAYEIGDIIQLNGFAGAANVVDIKCDNGRDTFIHIQWLNSSYSPQTIGISYINRMITYHNCKAIK